MSEKTKQVTAEELWFHYKNLTQQEKIEDILLDEFDKIIYEEQRMGVPDGEINNTIRKEITLNKQANKIRGVEQGTVVSQLEEINKILEGEKGESNKVEEIKRILGRGKTNINYYIDRERKNNPKGAERVRKGCK